jgi:hypothetical protein
VLRDKVKDKDRDKDKARDKAVETEEDVVVPAEVVVDVGDVEDVVEEEAELTHLLQTTQRKLPLPIPPPRALLFRKLLPLLLPPLLLHH